MERASLNISVFIFLSLIYVYTIYSLGNWFIDDAYITLTYSKNLALHGKPWYNLDGYFQGNGQTSILWMLIQSIFFLFKTSIKPETINLSINFILSLFILVNFSSLVKKTTILSLYNVTVLSIGILFSYWLGFNSKHGLETILYIYVLFNFLNNWDNKKSLFWSFILCFIRPEAIIFNVLYILDSKIFSKIFFQKSIVLLFSLITYFSYTYFFYNYLIPLPFVLKSIKEFGYIKCMKFLMFSIIFSPVLFYAISNYKKKLLFYAPLFIFLLYYSFFIDEVMNVADRYIFPLTIYFYFYFKDIKNNSFKYNRNYKFVYSIVTLFSVVFSIKYIHQLHQNKYIYKNYSIGMDRGPIYIGKYFEKEKNIKIATSDAGVIAFFSNNACYDTWGLNNATLLLAKKEKNWNKYNEYLKSLDLDYIVIISSTLDKCQPKLYFDEKIYDYFQLHNKPIVLKRKFEDNYYYFCYKL